ncbi:hypothetical protein ACUXIX_002415 [Staphylococcus capitis]
MWLLSPIYLLLSRFRSQYENNATIQPLAAVVMM